MVVPRKIEMKLVKSKSARQVTFCKRRNGVFNKANELSILCGAIVGMIVFSPGGKPYAFGHPTIEDVINNFLHHGPRGNVVNPSRGGGEIESLNKQLEDVMNKIQVEKDKGVKLDSALNKGKFIKGKKFNIDGLGAEELEKLKDTFGQVIDMLEVASSLLLLAKELVKFDED